MKVKLSGDRESTLVTYNNNNNNRQQLWKNFKKRLTFSLDTSGGELVFLALLLVDFIGSLCGKQPIDSGSKSDLLLLGPNKNERIAVVVLKSISHLQAEIGKT